MKPPADLLEQDAAAALGSAEFDEIRKLAHSTFGLSLRPGKEGLVSARLGRLVRRGGFRSFREYYRHVLTDRTGAALASMIDALATNHTSFLREPDHFAFLRETALKSLGTSQAVEVWCAACSTGEEVWTLAMTLNDACPQRRIPVTGSDISNRALRAAEAAEYTIDQCRGIPASWLQRYFVPGQGPAKTYRVAPQLRGLASFLRINLVEPLPFGRQFPLIFCRNAMIYFDRETQEQVVGRLAATLSPGGYLFVGHAESLNGIHHSLEYVRPAVYRKPGNQEGRWIRS